MITSTIQLPVALTKVSFKYDDKVLAPDIEWFVQTIKDMNQNGSTFAEGQTIQCGVIILKVTFLVILKRNGIFHIKNRTHR